MTLVTLICYHHVTSGASYLCLTYLWRLNNPFELPSLEEIEQMERQRLQAIESLDISSNSVKCQRCGHDMPIVGKLNRTCKVVILQRRIKWMENYYHGANINDLNQNSQSYSKKMLKQINFGACIAAELMDRNLYV